MFRNSSSTCARVIIYRPFKVGVRLFNGFFVLARCNFFSTIPIFVWLLFEFISIIITHTHVYFRLIIQKKFSLLFTTIKINLFRLYKLNWIWKSNKKWPDPLASQNVNVNIFYIENFMIIYDCLFLSFSRIKLYNITLVCTIKFESRAHCHFTTDTMFARKKQWSSNTIHQMEWDTKSEFDYRYYVAILEIRMIQKVYLSSKNYKRSKEISKW